MIELPELCTRSFPTVQNCCLTIGPARADMPLYNLSINRFNYKLTLITLQHQSLFVPDAKVMEVFLKNVTD